MKKKELDAMNVGDEVIDKKNGRFTFTGMNEKSFYMFKGKKSGAIIGMSSGYAMSELEVVK